MPLKSDFKAAVSDNVVRPVFSPNLDDMRLAA
jgi:hypothetical protein